MTEAAFSISSKGDVICAGVKKMFALPERNE